MTRRSPDPFTSLGLRDDASAEDVRAARRRLAMAHHPDRGGDAAEMQRLNDAAARALRVIARRDGQGGSGGADGHDAAPTTTPAGDGTDGQPPSGPSTHQEPSWSRTATDVPSFTVEALPAEAFEALLVVAPSLGEILDDDPPYRLDAYLGTPYECWCRLDVVPDAGSSTVSLTVGSIDGQPVPPIETVRDLWIAELNALDW